MFPTRNAELLDYNLCHAPIPVNELLLEKWLKVQFRHHA